MAIMVELGTRVERPSPETHGRSCVQQVDLRRMLEHAARYRSDILEGRFIIETRNAGGPWDAIVEPDEIRQLLVVITAYPVE
jgi:hypothetical protein